MLIIPAIDLMAGKVVRLFKGAKDSAKIYSNDPCEVANHWKSQGAKLIHVVDLDAAFGAGDNLAVVAKLTKIGIDIEFGGGIRSIEKAQKALSLGVKRVIIGTKAVDPLFLSEILKNFPQRVGVGIDVLNGKFMKSGWQEKTQIDFENLVTALVKTGVDWIIYTDISRDGTLSGVNIKEADKLKNIKGADFILSGGIDSIESLALIKDKLPFMSGTILGKALYEGRINLAQAIKKFQ